MPNLAKVNSSGRRFPEALHSISLERKQMKIDRSGLARVGRSSALAAAAAMALGATAAYAVPYPTKATPAARDLGAANDAQITVTVSLKHRDAEKLGSLLQGLYTPGHPQFHKFLSAREFHERF